MKLHARLPIILGLSLVFLSIQRFGPNVPAIGYVLLAVCITLYIPKAIKERRLPNFRDPLTLTILGFVVLVSVQVIIGLAKIETLALIFMLVFTFLIAKEHGNEARKVFLPFTAVLSGSIIVDSIVNGWSVTGGITSSFNYNLGSGVLILCVLLTENRHRWLSLVIATPGLMLTGASEGIVSIALLALFVVIQRDFSKKLIYVGALVGILFIVLTPLGITSQLSSQTMSYITSNNPLPESYIQPGVDRSITGDNLQRITNNRWYRYVDVVQNIKPVGNGFYSKSSLVENLPLRILYETGVVGLLLWCVILGYGLKDKNTRYIFAAIIAVNLFDHYIWSEIPVYLWFAIGLIGSSKNGQYIFK